MKIQTPPKHRLHILDYPVKAVLGKDIITISLHFLQLSFISLDDANLAISSTKIGIRLGEQQGITSKVVVLSTNLIRAFQSFKREFTKTAKRKRPSLVP